MKYDDDTPDRPSPTPILEGDYRDVTSLNDIARNVLVFAPEIGAFTVEIGMIFKGVVPVDAIDRGDGYYERVVKRQ